MEPRICVSLGHLKWRELQQALERFELVELRLDLLGLGERRTAEVFRRHRQAVATYRPGADRSERERLRLLELAVRSGAAFLDIELEMAEGPARRLVGLAKRHGCRVIMSYHDTRCTPGRRKLEEIRRACFRRGADLAKIACRVRHPRDAARLLSLLSGRPTTLVSALGPYGTPLRVMAAWLGAPFVYASPAPGRETAEGQPVEADLRRLWHDFCMNIDLIPEGARR